jgi:hypothetical protein
MAETGRYQGSLTSSSSHDKVFEDAGQVDREATVVTKRRRLPIVDSILIGRVIKTAESQIDNPPGFFFQAMPVARTPHGGGQGSAKKNHQGSNKKAPPVITRKQRAAATKADAEAAKVAAQQLPAPAAAGPAEGRETDPGGGHHKGDQPGRTIPPRAGESGSSPTSSGNAEKDQGEGNSAELAKTPSSGLADSPRKRKASGSDKDEGAKQTKRGTGSKVTLAAETGGRDSDHPIEEGGSSPSDISNSSLLGFGSDTDFLSDMYAIIDSEVKRDGSIVLESLLQPGAIQQVTQLLEAEREERRVMFPVFTRYFLARGRASENMIADLLNYRESNQNGGAPLNLRTDVPRLRQIAHMRMVYANKT